MPPPVRTRTDALESRERLRERSRVGIAEPGVVARVYSGSSGNARAQRREHVPITMVDITLDAGATFEQDLPATHNGFLYVLSGSLRVGARDGGALTLREGQVGWLDRSDASDVSTLRLTADDAGARVVLYAGDPQNYPIETHGPFVGGSRADLMRMSREFMGGEYARMSELARAAATSK